MKPAWIDHRRATWRDGMRRGIDDRFKREWGRRESEVSQDINVLALVKGEERYIFLYDDASRAETLRMLGRFASDADLSFTWYDAAVLSQKVRAQETTEAPKTTPRFKALPASDSAPDAER